VQRFESFAGLAYFTAVMAYSRGISGNPILIEADVGLAYCKMTLFV
jgi:hypothetical protein